MKRIATGLLVVLLATVASRRAVGESPMHPEIVLKDGEGTPVLASGAPVSMLRTCGQCHDVEFIERSADHARPDCFLCHAREPAVSARDEMLRDGRSEWAATATLAHTGLVARDGDGWRYVRERFAPDGRAPRSALGLGDPSSAHCGACHMDADLAPVSIGAAGTWTTRDPEAAGQVYSPQRIRDSALNLRGKDGLVRPWDVHAERVLACADCHHALNNPVRFSESERTRPGHLLYDARRTEIGDYLRTPSHELTRGESARPHADRSLDASMRRCEDCHDAGVHEAWLPATSRHLTALLCEACHVPDVRVPAIEAVDRTVVRLDGRPVVVHRGAEGVIDDPATLLTGYEPVLLPRSEKTGRRRLGPHNLTTTWTWVSGAAGEPVGAAALASAWTEGGRYAAPVLAAFDADRNGDLDASELRVDTVAKLDVLRRRLEVLDVEEPRIVGVIEPSALHHGVVSGRYATRSCEACHAESSRLSQPFELSPYVPFGAGATLVAGTNVRMPGAISADAGGPLVYRPSLAEAGLHVAAHGRTTTVDGLGVVLVLASLLGVSVHGALRVVHARRRSHAVRRAGVPR